MNRRLSFPRLLAVVVALGAVIAYLVHGYGKRASVIEDGVEYQILSFAKVDTVKNADGAIVPAYLVTFTYAEGDQNTRGTIAVPRYALLEDESLPANRIIWDYPVILEGRTYRQVRWHPNYKVPAREVPELKEEKPLVRDK